MGLSSIKSSPQAQSQKPQTRERLDYLDNFRTFLTCLVIYHHVAIPYGGLGSWGYTSTHHAPATSLPLMAFNLINQSYFMGSFFFLSGYFSAKAWKRKGTATFLWMKWLKLGVPAIVFTLFAGPIQMTMMKASKGESLGLEILTDHWRSLRGFKGPVWYCAVTLVFDIIYTSLPNLANLLSIGFLPVMGLNIAASFLIRHWYPVGVAFKPLNLQVAFLPQYICCYALGATLQTPAPILTKTSRKVLVAGSLASTASMLGLIHYYPEAYPNPTESIFGGPNLLALAYAIWNETTGYLLGTSLLKMFKNSGRLSRSWGVGGLAYAAFLVHPVVCCVVHLGFDGWKGSGVA